MKTTSNPKGDRALQAPIPSPAPTPRDKSSVAMDPAFRHSIVGGALAHNTSGIKEMSLTETHDLYRRACADIAAADLSRASNMLTSQALTLDAVFTEMLDRVTSNLGKYPDATERYMRLALKAQAQSRATIEALVRMHQPREQTVRHVHVGPNGHAVFIENLHGGLGNARYDERAHAQGAPSTALLGHDTSGHGVPVACSEGAPEVSHARRQRGKRRADRQL